MQDLESLKYPIGEYNPPQIITEILLKEWIEQLTSLPQEIVEITANLSDEDLEIPYRPDGWTVRQVIHHLADSHINAYTRVHLTLTEDTPTVRPYHEERWAELADGKSGDIQVSIDILKAIHQRLVALLKTLNLIDFDRTYSHPGAGKQFTLGYLVGNYAWHGKHHLAHIQLIFKEDLKKHEADEIISSKLKGIIGSVSLPKNFNEEKELDSYFKNKL